MIKVPSRDIHAAVYHIITVRHITIYSNYSFSNLQSQLILVSKTDKTSTKQGTINAQYIVELLFTMIQWWSGIIYVFCRNPDVIFGQFEFLLSSQLNGRLFKFVKIQVSHSPQCYFAKLTDADPEILSFIIWCASTWIPNHHWTCKKADTCTVGRGLKLNEYNCPETHHMQHIDMTYI